jgi:hypothetical protein
MKTLTKFSVQQRSGSEGPNYLVSVGWSEVEPGQGAAPPKVRSYDVVVDQAVANSLLGLPLSEVVDGDEPIFAALMRIAAWLEVGGSTSKPIELTFRVTDVTTGEVVPTPTVTVVDVHTGTTAFTGGLGPLDVGGYGPITLNLPVLSDLTIEAPGYRTSTIRMPVRRHRQHQVRLVPL